MATLLLSYAGTALGGLLGGPVGAAVGRAAGAIAGNLIDQQLFGGGTRRAEGPRLKDLRVMSSTEGAAVPKAWGRVRVAGQVIWSTNFDEIISTQTERAGGKGGGGGARTKVTTYSYFANFAVALAEGPIARVGRLWADGKPFDPEGLAWRFYDGSEDQLPDSLIVAKEGADNAPAYRGVSYMVFEHMPLERFGNRLPQLSFEIFRPISRAASLIRAVNLIPGATEFGYDTDVVTRQPSEGVTESENAHALSTRSDWSVSLDDLQATCRNLDSVSLVVAWFGNDLRCGSCAVKPGVEVPLKTTSPHVWKAGGISRADAHVVSQVGNGPAFGGTPADASVLRAIADLKSRGLKTVFYPFILMDIPAGNVLPDPYTGPAGQPAYPWRGRITCAPAPGRPGTPDKSAAINTQIASFTGTAQPSHFTTTSGEITYSGPAEWSYRRMILHYAHLCALAGGVDSFLIGSELRGLTTLRNSASTYPFVTALAALAAEVANILLDAKVSYAADWSEYFGHQPADGSSDVFFHLDPLWASAGIHYIGIDNYMPLSDWRNSPGHLDKLSGATAIHDTEYLQANVAGGEGYHWFYASAADRDAQVRSPITDGAYAKPWVFRYKDLKSWWNEPHFNRPGGAESAVPTGWIPKSKPIRFTEAGCPAIDKGTNQPNVFIDPKSVENAVPYHSSGARDDFIMLRYVEALMDYWSAPGPHNPVSPLYGAPMVDAPSTHFWSWDARPFPAFPALDGVWSDGANFARGHWLNARLGAAPMPELVKSICASYGFDAVDTSGIHGVADGVAIERTGSARDALEPIARAWSFDAIETGGIVRFASRSGDAVAQLARDDLVDDEGPLYRLTRAQETDLPQRLKLAYAESGRDYRTAVVEAQRKDTPSAREIGIELPCAVEQGEAARRAEIMLQEIWAGRETISFALAPSRMPLEPGDIVSLATNVSTLSIRIEDITEGELRRISGRLHDAAVYEAGVTPSRGIAASPATVLGKPLAQVLDLPLAGEGRQPEAAWFACSAKPWPGRLNLFRKTGESAFSLERQIDSPGVIGALTAPLAEGPLCVFDRSNTLHVRLFGGALASVSEAEMLGGANAAAIGSPGTGWEIVQFRDAVLTGPRTYELRHLLRGQSGSEPEMAMLASSGTSFVLLDAALIQMNQTLADFGAAVTWRIGPAKRDHGDPSYGEFSHHVRGLGLRPLRPAQLRATRDGADVIFTWIRRTRIDGDSWEVTEVPLGETAELYGLDIMSGAAPVRSMTLNQPLYRYSAALQSADFGTPPQMFTVRLAQIGETYGRGAVLERTLHV